MTNADLIRRHRGARLYNPEYDTFNRDSTRNWLYQDRGATGEGRPAPATAFR
jgi:hypothetical protein